jgi:hypothetical protein
LEGREVGEPMFHRKRCIMETITKIFVLTLTAGLLVAMGCQSTYNQRDYTAITIGQTVQELEQELGRPAEQTAKAWIYHEPFYRVIVPVQNEKVAGKIRYEKYEENVMGVSKYWSHIH